MGRISLEARILAFAFLSLCIAENSWATKREDLERAAELAVERAAERAAERAVEKALESGNSTTESETIRESYSSVRKSDKTLQLPGFGYTPAQRHEYDRIIREREAGERASALLKRSVDNGGIDARRQFEVGINDERNSEEKQQLYQPEKNLPETTSFAMEPFYVTRQLPFPVEGYENPYTTAVGYYQQQQHQQSFPPAIVNPVRDEEQFPSLYMVKVFPIQMTMPYPLKRFRVMSASMISVPVATSTSAENNFIDREAPRVVNTGDHTIANEDARKANRVWIYRRTL